MRTSRAARPVSPLLLVMLFILAAAAGGEAYALIRLRQDLDRVRKTHPSVVHVPQPRPTDNRGLTYSAPVVVAAKPVRDAPLAVDDEGAVLAASLDGNLVRIDHRGMVIQLPDQLKVFGKPLAPTREPLLLAADISGNRYQVNPGSKALAKYDPEGTLLDGAIGAGKLVRPSALAVDQSGNLYVIDDHIVKKITALEPPQASAGAANSR